MISPQLIVNPPESTRRPAISAHLNRILESSTPFGRTLMYKYLVAGLLLIAPALLPAVAETAAVPESAWLEAEGTGMETPERGDLRQEVLSQRRSGMEELARAVALTVFFRTDSMAVGGEILSRVRLLGGFLRQFPELRVYLDAHSDRRGSNAHNRRLSRARTDVIAGVLQAAGIPANRIHGNAWGESQARTTSDDAEGLIFDRRVDIQLRLEPEA
jgi:outer membrane protein OmpA-like peptidoglycan-associated protein